MKWFLGFVAFMVALSVRADCIQVDGLQFEPIDRSELLIMRGGVNLGTLYVGTGGKVKDFRTLQNLQFRFFTPKLCDTSPNNKFHLNGELVESILIKIFNK
jgi:hypothetical protein